MIRRVRQSCSLSPLLFNIMMTDIADMEEEMGKIMGCKIRKKKGVLLDVCG